MRGVSAILGAVDDGGREAADSRAPPLAAGPRPSAWRRATARSRRATMTAAAAIGAATSQNFRLKAEATGSIADDPIHHAPAQAWRRLDVEHLAHRAVDRVVEPIPIPAPRSPSSDPRPAQTSVYPIAVIFCFNTFRASDTRHFTVPVGIFSIRPISS